METESVYQQNGLTKKLKSQPRIQAGGQSPFFACRRSRGVSLEIENSTRSQFSLDGCCKILVPYRKCVGAVQPGECRSVSRRGICDRAIWRKPLAFVAVCG